MRRGRRKRSTNCPLFRWEFNVTLSGCGRTKEEAWEDVRESVSGDGLGRGDIEDALTEKEADEMRVKGRDHAYRCEVESSCWGPAGTMLAWED